MFALLVIALLATTAGTASAQTDRKPVDVRPVPVVEELRLACNPDVIHGERGILCRWSATKVNDARAYQLYRVVDGSPRQLLTTVPGDGRRAYFDTDVSAPSTLIYGVTALNRSGRLIGVGGPERITLGDQVEQLRFACAPDSIEGKRGVLCRWSATTQRDARGYLLYRTVNDGPRELIARVGLDGRRANFDTDVEPGGEYLYAVLAVDRAGEVIGRGGPVRVVWPGID